MVLRVLVPAAGGAGARLDSPSDGASLADQRQERAHGDTRHEEAEAAAEHRLELARSLHEGDAGTSRLDKALATLAGAARTSGHGQRVA